ncbi:MAG: hypothetical protein K8S98_09860 [Planctomycetes bacterium]|nr:hypothetical protein [Planctomycetota bacterium]
MKLGRLVLALTVIGTACTTTRAGFAPLERPVLAPVVTSEPPKLAPATPAPFALDPEWRTMSLERFETWVQQALPGREPIEIAKPERAELKRALAVMDVVSVRAAVILARSRERQAYEILLQRLEDRVVGPERPNDAGDVVAAAALGKLRNVVDLGKRLEELVVGPRPHPDLEVRIECAASLLEYKRTRGIGFLLRVLRDATPAADVSKRDWTPTPHMAWAKSRAAAALSKYLETPCNFRPDGSVQHEMEEAARLEELWRVKKRLLEPPKN